MESLKKTEKIFSNSIDISTKAEYIVTIKSYLHPNKGFGKERKMKKVLSVLAVLAVAAGFAFAEGADKSAEGADKSFKLTTSVSPVNKFKVFAPKSDPVTYAQVVDASVPDDLSSVPVSTSETELKTVAVATNEKGRSVKVTATGTPLASGTVTTKMGYTFTVDSNPSVSVSKDARDAVNLGTIVKLTGDGGQNNVKQALLKAAVDSGDYTAAAAGNDYEATVALTLTVE